MNRRELLKAAAALPLAGLTAYRAVFSRGGLSEGENVLITTDTQSDPMVGPIIFNAAVQA